MITSPTVSALRTPRGPVTVRYDARAAMTVRPDWARALTGHDGFSMATAVKRPRVQGRQVAVAVATTPVN
ncbi:hypothetical protein ACFU93_21915 [Streptomyces sp. NPDC057611]|uniref:hypothetical protein n=1 Tax=Streptomyces sp. NPDC057611 TaxID=3346182 RepID=UPI0036AA8415